jgi:hypothetical protein
VNFLALYRSGSRIGYSGVTDAQHDRLVQACTQESEEPTVCTAFVADLVAWAEDNELTYTELTAEFVESIRGPSG